jgi:hypothetical protein
MPLKYLLDEHVRGLLLRHIQRHNAGGRPWIDAVQVGDAPDLPLGSTDPELLAWGEREGRILVSIDKRTLATHLRAHLESGRHSPGIFLVREAPFPDVVEFLCCAAHASEPQEWADTFTYIP